MCGGGSCRTVIQIVWLLWLLLSLKWTKTSEAKICLYFDLLTFLLSLLVYLFFFWAKSPEIRYLELTISQLLSPYSFFPCLNADYALAVLFALSVSEGCGREQNQNIQHYWAFPSFGNVNYTTWIIPLYSPQWPY